MQPSDEQKIDPEEFSALKKEVARLKKQVEEMDPSCSFADMEEKELRHFIENLRPDREMYAGKKFLLALLDSRGVNGVDKFANKALKALSDEGQLDIPHNFDVVETEIFKKTALRLWHRKEFLTSMAWTIPGAALMLKTPLDIAMVATGKPHKESADTHSKELQQAHDLMTKISLLTDLPLAAALVYEGIKHDREMRLEHIADAVSELADRIKEERKKSEGRS